MNRKKKLILRSLLGFPIGIAIGYIITIIISLIWANGDYISCEPELLRTMGSEIRAVLLQTLLCGVLGIGFSASSLIWEIESWSVIKQTCVYFGIVSVIMMPVAYFSYWMEHSIIGFLRYFGIFLLIFLIIWCILFFTGMCTVKRMNDGLHQTKHRQNRK